MAVRLRIAQRGEDLIETVKALPGLIKDWMSNSDLIYQLVGCPAGVLTIAACVREQRPSEVLAAAMHAMGASGIGGGSSPASHRYLPSRMLKQAAHSCRLRHWLS